MAYNLPLREEFRIKAFENRVLRQIFEIKSDENGEWRRLHNEELHNLYRTPNRFWVIKSRRLRWGGHLARMEVGRSALQMLTGKPTGKRPFYKFRLSYITLAIVEIKKNYYKNETSREV